MTLLLARGNTIAATARSISCDEKTIDIWKRNPEFMAAVHKAEDDLYDEAIRDVKKTLHIALACLVRNCDPKVSNYVQVQAASSLSERKSEALTTAISTLKVGDYRSILGLKRPSSGEIFGEKRSLRQTASKLCDLALQLGKAQEIEQMQSEIAEMMKGRYAR